MVWTWMLMTLAQGTPLADAPATAPVTRKPMSFGDLQRGFRAYNDGAADNTARNGLLVVVAVVLLLALVLHWRARQKAARAPDSETRLAWELSRLVPFPFGTRLLLWWVARSNRVNFATLLISPSVYQRSVRAWAEQPTFALVRRWGHSRLGHLERMLFQT